MSGPISRQRSTVLDTADLKVLTYKSTDSSVTTLAIVLAARTTISSYFDVESSDATSTDGFS